MVWVLRRFASLLNLTASSAWTPSSSLSLDQNVHNLVCVFFEPGLQFLGGCCTQGCAGAGCQVYTVRSAVICTNTSRDVHFQPVPTKELRLQGQQRAIYSCGQGGGGCLCSYLGTGLPVRWCLALLAGIPPTLPPRRFKVLKALGTRPELAGSSVEPGLNGGRRWVAPRCAVSSSANEIASPPCSEPHCGPQWISGSSPNS